MSRRCGVADLRERNRVGNRAATVDAAFALFADRGYCHVTVADICDAAGIGRRTFFRYFATKDDVLTEPARELAAQVAAAITSAPAGLPEAQVLRQALTEIAAYALSHRARLHQLAEVRKASADIRWSPLTRLSEQEQALAGQLAARRGTAPHPAGRPGCWSPGPSRACASGSTTSPAATAPTPGSTSSRSSTPNHSSPPLHPRKQQTRHQHPGPAGKGRYFQKSPGPRPSAAHGARLTVLNKTPRDRVRPSAVSPDRRCGRKAAPGHVRNRPENRGRRGAEPVGGHGASRRAAAPMLRTVAAWRGRPGYRGLAL